jgi:hypothetical protein
MNYFDGPFKKSGVYHYSDNLCLLKSITVPNGMSDHDILIFNFKGPFVTLERTFVETVCDRVTVEENYRSMSTKMMAMRKNESNGSIKLVDARRNIRKHFSESCIHPDNYTDYANMRD